MTQYGPTLLTKLVATTEDLSQLVICTPELPDPNTVVAGSTMILSKSQKDYVASHVYKAVESSGRLFWVDVTDGFCEKVNYITDPTLKVVYVPKNDCPQYTDFTVNPVGELSNRENELQSLKDAGAGDLKYLVIVRKSGVYAPITPDDGEVVVKIPLSSTTHSYQYTFFDKQYARFDDIELYLESYKYSAFEVFESNWYCNVDIVNAHQELP